MNVRTGRVLFVVILASLCYVAICSKGLIKIIPNTERCKILDRTFIQKYTCKSKNMNRTLNLSSKEIIFCPGVSLSNYHTHVVLYRKFTTVYRQFMIDISIDSCALRAGKPSTSTQHIQTERRLKYGNMWHPCPLSGRRYEIDVPMDTENNTLDIFPSGEYRVDAKAYTMVNGQRKYLLLTQSYGEVKYTTAEQWFLPPIRSGNILNSNFRVKPNKIFEVYGLDAKSSFQIFSVCQSLRWLHFT